MRIPQEHTQEILTPQHQRRIIILNYLSFASLGLMGGAFGPGLPTLARQMNVGLDIAGVLVSGNSVGYLIASLTAGPLMDSLGRRPVYLTALGLAAMSQLAFLGVPSLTFGLLVALFGGLGKGSMNVASHVVVGDAAPENRSAALNRLHVFFGAGALMGPTLTGYSLKSLDSLWLAFGLIAALTLLSAVGLTLTPLPSPAVTPKSAVSNVRAVIGNRRFWGLAAFFFLYVGVEVGVGTWTFAFLREGLDSGVTLASWAASGFFLALTGGRLAGSRLAGRQLADEKLVLLSLGGAVGGGLLLWAGGAAQTALLLVGGVLAVGFCFGPVFPTAMSVAQRRYAESAGTVVGLLTAMGSLGIVAIPWLQGWLLARRGLTWGAAVTATGAAALLTVASVAIRQRPDK